MSLYRLILAVFSIIANLPTISGSQEPYEICQNKLQEAKNCWLMNPELPGCTTEYELVNCAGQVYVESLQCDEDTLEQIKIIQKAYKELGHTICSNEDLHSEFASKISCWYVARTCAYETIASLYLDDIDEEGCLERDDNYELCRDSWCGGLQNRLINPIRLKSPCAKMTYGGSSAKNTATIAASFLTAAITFFLIS